MTAVELQSSQMLPPFVVFDGTKLKTAKNPERTLAHKYRNWRNSKPGRTGHMCFHPKHWFDSDVTTEWFDWLLNVVYPGKKVGVSMDQAPQHKSATVQEYLKKKYDEGRLVVEFIDGGLTSVIQVCDLDANKPLKVNIKRGYLKYRAEFIKAERAKHPNEPNKRIQMKVPIEKMMELVEASVKEFNVGQRKTRSIEKTFISAGQHPWMDCEEQFEAHLDGLSKLPLYGGCQSLVQDLLMDKAFESKAEVVFEPRRSRVDSLMVEADEMEEDGDVDGKVSGKVGGEVSDGMGGEVGKGASC